MLTKSQLTRLRRTRTDKPNKIRLAMQLTGVRQVQLAAAIGIAQSQISEDAAGKFIEISLDKARAYARFFGCEVEDLFPVQEEAMSA